MASYMRQGYSNETVSTTLNLQELSRSETNNNSNMRWVEVSGTS